MKYKKSIYISIATLIVVFCLIYIVPISRKIDKELDCIDYNNKNDVNIKKSKMKIKGTYYDFVFAKDSFVGEINIDSLDISKNKKLGPINLKNGSTLLTYKIDGDYKTVGMIIVDNKFNQVLIYVYDENEHGGGWNSNNGRVISAPATSLKEAKQNANFISKKFKFMIDTN